jgi:uncharacterized repeat protein (TIGR03803 family)
MNVSFLRGLHRGALRVFFFVVLAGCSANLGSPVAPNRAALPNAGFMTADSGRESLLYSFGGLPARDGQEPDGALIEDATGAFYGTTLVGGLRGAYCGLGGCGLVFKVAPSGPGYVENVIYRFHGASGLGNDGASPIGALAQGPHGILYGVTYAGGTVKSQGTVFALTPSASGYAETLLHIFPASAKDGSLPCAGVTLDKSGALYGTTAEGGAYGAGTVFKLTPSASGYSETILHDFNGNDGTGPQATLVIDAQGTIYGTTTGHATNCGGIANHGTVFTLTPSGSGYVAHVLYKFPNKASGQGPNSSVLIGKNGVLYGTTEIGGTHGFGTVYELTPNGTNYTFKTAYIFRKIPDGIGPNGVIAGPGGSLYGTATSGGDSLPGCNRIGCGTVFKLTPSGGSYVETVLWNFRSVLDGQHPSANLLLKSGALYGTTMFGGGGQNAYAGSVFKVVP